MFQIYSSGGPQGESSADLVFIRCNVKNKKKQKKKSFAGTEDKGVKCKFFQSDLKKKNFNQKMRMHNINLRQSF